MAVAAAPEPMSLPVAVGLVQLKQRRGKGMVSVRDKGEEEGLHGGERGGVGGGGC